MNKIDDDQSDPDFWNDHDEASEISHAVIGKCLFQSSKQRKRKRNGVEVLEEIEREANV